MILYSRMGWLVLAIWLAAVALASKIPPEYIARHGFGLSKVAIMFLLAAAISSPLLFAIGALLNRNKVPRTIVRFGKEKTVHWGTHTFYMLPVEYWAIMIPVATVIAFLISQI